MKPEVWMIQIPDNPISMYYRGRVEKSWREYNLKFFNAITPENNTKDYLNFGKKRDKIEFTPTEKAVWYSHVELWAKARTKPILIIEHDAMLYEPIPDDIWESDMACIGHCYRNGERKTLAGLSYYLTPKVARNMVAGVKQTKNITWNSDATIYRTCKQKGIFSRDLVGQIKNDTIGTTIEHLYQ
jgi:hypothetical protein